MNERLSSLLTGLLQPAWEDRLTVAQAQDVLAGKARSSRQQRQQSPFGQHGREYSSQRSRGPRSGRQVIVVDLNAEYYFWVSSLGMLIASSTTCIGSAYVKYVACMKP